MIANDQTLPAEVLLRFLRYDEETGCLYWRARKPSDFLDGYRTAVGCCNNWNSIYAESRALAVPKIKGHLGGSVNGFKVLAHRAIWAMKTGRWPVHQIDHINGDPVDNRFENLRDVTNAENHRNVKLQCNNTSGHHGVRFIQKSGRWQARIKHNRREHFLGSFDLKEDAISARKKAESECGFHQNHGRKATLQTPLEIPA